MKTLVLTFSTNSTNPGLIHLINSLRRHGYDYEVLVDEQFSWGGDNYVLIADWLRRNRRGYTHFLYTDAWDTVAQGPVEELTAKYTALSPDHSAWIYSGEKNPCFAGSRIEKFTADSPWKYLCAGGYITPIDLYIDVVHTQKRSNENDQVWGSNNYTSGEYNILLDTGCEIFQTMYNFDRPSVEFGWRDRRIYNQVTATQPLFLHGNGKVDMRWIYHPSPD
jgi:hypothetical protein